MGEWTWTGRELTVDDTEHVEVVLEEVKKMIAGEMRRRWLLRTTSKHGNKAMARTVLTDKEVEDNFGPAVTIPEPPEDAGKTRDELILEYAQRDKG